MLLIEILFTSLNQMLWQWKGKKKIHHLWKSQGGKKPIQSFHLVWMNNLVNSCKLLQQSCSLFILIMMMLVFSLDTLCSFPQCSLLWTCPPAVARQCAFMHFGRVALEWRLKGRARVFQLDTFKNLAYSFWFLHMYLPFLSTTHLVLGYWITDKSY